LRARQQTGVLSHSTSFKGGCVSSVKSRWIDTTAVMGARAHARRQRRASPKAHSEAPL
jgi:hypothetical protein